MDNHKNFAYSTVLVAPSPASSGTSLTLASGGGALMPIPPFNCTVWPIGQQPLSNNAEIVRVTNIVGDVLTIVRAQEGSTARAIIVGDQFSATITNKTLTDIETMAVSGDLAGNLPSPTVYKATLTDQAAPSAPPSGTLLLQSFNQQGFSVPHVYDTQGNAIELTRDNITIARNNSGGTINKGQVVYVTGSTGSVPTVAKAKADSSTTLPCVAIMYETTANNSFGRMMILGNLENFNLSAFNTGDLLYVSAATAGSLTNVKPTYPNFAQSIGTVLNNGVGNGVLQVFIRVVQGVNNGDAAGGDLSGTYPNPTVASLANVKKGSLEVIADGLGGVITVNNYLELTIPYNATITDWLVSSVNPPDGTALSCSIVFDIKRSGSSIIGSGNKPTLASQSSNSASVSGWSSVTVTAGDKLAIYVVSSTSGLKVNMTLNMTKT